MGRGTYRHPWLAMVLIVALGLLTPMAANMVGARAGLRAVPTGVSSVVTVVAEVPRGFAPPASGVRPDPSKVVARAAREAREARWTSVLVHVQRTLPAFARPRAGASRIGVVPAGSKYYGFPIVAWVEVVSPNGRWGLVELPYTWPRTEGWIRLDGLRRSTTRVRVEVDLSSHTVTVRKFGAVLFRAPGATGASSSPTPVGEYFVTDRVAFPAGSYLGSFAFGISGIQPRLPAGWSGGNQLAIHGTNNPSSIGRSASAGCIRVSEATLDRLLPLLRYGTPVIVRN
ncbi:MAG TPA: L,D-transpeptidase [Actinomycetota bacterium]|nr:L,D-transpeptidase [Actinomycetota bacterium]